MLTVRNEEQAPYEAPFPKVVEVCVYYSKNEGTDAIDVYLQEGDREFLYSHEVSTEHIVNTMIDRLTSRCTKRTMSMRFGGDGSMKSVTVETLSTVHLRADDPDYGALQREVKMLAAGLTLDTEPP